MAFVVDRDDRRWKQGILPFEIGPDVRANAIALNAVNTAIEAWNNSGAPIRLVQRTSESDHLDFRLAAEACQTGVGRYGGRHVVSCAVDTTDFNAGSVMHEIGHALGFYHEHQRHDREQYVTIDPSAEHDINYRVPNDGWTLTDYDCSSIMHYRSIVGKIELSQPCQGQFQRNAPSRDDVNGVRRAYHGTWVLGSLKQISVGRGGSVWGVNSNNEIFRWNGGKHDTGNRWTLIGGSLKQISVGPTQVWGVNSYDQIWRWDGGTGTGNDWSLLGGYLRQVSVGAEGVWGVNSAEQIWRWHGGAGTGNHWERVGGFLRQISVGDQVWGVNSNDQIWRWRGGSGTGNDWERIDGSLRQVSACGPTVAGVNANGEAYYWYGGSASTGNRWRFIGWGFAHVAASVDTMWGIDAQGEVFRIRI